MQHIASGDPTSSVLAGVGVFTYFKHGPLDIPSITLEEALDIIAVNRLPPVKAEHLANGCNTPQAAKTHPSHRDAVQPASPLVVEPATCAGRAEALNISAHPHHGLIRKTHSHLT